MIAKDGITKYRIWTHLSFRTWARVCSGVLPSTIKLWFSYNKAQQWKGLPWKPKLHHRQSTRCHTVSQTIILYKHTERFLLLNFKTSMHFTSPELITTHFSWPRPGLYDSSLCLIRWGCRFRSAAKPAVIGQTRESQGRGGCTRGRRHPNHTLAHHRTLTFCPPASHAGFQCGASRLCSPPGWRGHRWSLQRKTKMRG